MLSKRFILSTIARVLGQLFFWIDRRRPFQEKSWPSTLAMHVALTVPFSLIHVGGMVALRKMVYLLHDRFYDFGNVPVELLYEYRKDFFTYFMILFVIYAYRHFRFRYSNTAGFLEESGQKASNKPISRLLIRSGNKETFLKVDEIERIEAAGNYVTIGTPERQFFLRSTLNQIEEKLSPELFVRVHRSAIVNLDHVREIIPYPSGDGRIVLNSGAHVALSRRFRDRLKPLKI